MSYSFNGSSSALDVGSAILTGYPMSMACWFNPASAAVTYSAISIDEKASSGGVDRFGLVPNAGTIRTTRGSAGTIVNADSTGAYQAARWNHGCGVFTSATLATSYNQGGFAGTNVTSNTPAGIDQTTIGARWSSSALTTFFSGLIAEAAIWNCALTASDVRALAAGMAPSAVRPESIVLYLPLRGDTFDRSIFGRVLTNTACVPVSNHPNIFVPHGYDKTYLVGPPIVAGGFHSRYFFDMNRRVA